MSTDEREVARQRAEILKSAQNSLRYEHRLWCPHDQRLVAAVVVAGADRFLWIVGGKVRRTASAIAEAEVALAAEVERRPQDEAALLTHRRFIEARERVLANRRGAAVVPPSAWSYPDPVGTGATTGIHSPRGNSTWDYSAVCPKCQAPYFVRIAPGAPPVLVPTVAASL